MIRGLNTTVNKLVDKVVDLANDIQYSNNRIDFKIDLATIEFNPPTVLDFDLEIPEIDASVVRIPEKPFSLPELLNPFVEDVFEVFLTIAYWCIIIGVVLLIY